MKRTKVRFNLGKGENYMKWKITYPNGDYQYLDPKTTHLNLFGCQFKNSKATSKRIHDGGEKVVCAWVLCNSLTINHIYDEHDGTEVRYNPRIQPNWMLDGVDIDNKSTDRVFSVGRKLFIK